MVLPMSADIAYNKLLKLRKEGAMHYTLVQEAMKLATTGYDYCLEDDMLAAYFGGFVILITFNSRITLLEVRDEQSVHT